MQELFNLLSNDEIRDAIIKALHDDEAVNLDSPEFKLNLSHDNNKLILTLEQKNTAKLESKKFKDFIQTLPDHIFQETCELIGKEGINKMSECLESDNIESVRSAIILFKNALRKYLVTNINSMQTLLKKV